MEEKTSNEQNDIQEDRFLTENQITSPTHPYATTSQLHHQKLLETEDGENNLQSETPIPLDQESVRSRQSTFEKELKNLKSYNPAGAKELNHFNPISRKRNPSYQRAKYIYEDALMSLRSEIQEFHAQDFQNMNSD